MWRREELQDAHLMWTFERQERCQWWCQTEALQGRSQRRQQQKLHGKTNVKLVVWASGVFHTAVLG